MNAEEGLSYLNQVIKDFESGRLKTLVIIDGDNSPTYRLTYRHRVQYLSIQKFHTSDKIVEAFILVLIRLLKHSY